MSLSLTLTFSPFMPLPGLVFEWVELFSCLSSVFLCCTLPHVLLVVLSEVFLEPCCGLYCPNTTHQLDRTAREKNNNNRESVIYQQDHHLHPDKYLQLSPINTSVSYSIYRCVLLFYLSNLLNWTHAIAYLSPAVKSVRSLMSNEQIHRFAQAVQSILGA